MIHESCVRHFYHTQIHIYIYIWIYIEIWDIYSHKDDYLGKNRFYDYPIRIKILSIVFYKVIFITLIVNTPKNATFPNLPPPYKLDFNLGMIITTPKQIMLLSTDLMSGTMLYYYATFILFNSDTNCMR